VGAFFLVDRILQRRKQPVSDDSLQACIQNSLLQVNRQIWLQRNVFWWCWLPFTTALAVSFGYAFLRFHTPKFLAFLVLFVIPLAWWGYRLSQFTVRKVLEPRRRELETLLASRKENPQ
jgi:lipopolysaccharide export LptBFGC system permease protein LptF